MRGAVYSRIMSGAGSAGAVTAEEQARRQRVLRLFHARNLALREPSAAAAYARLIDALGDGKGPALHAALLRRVLMIDPTDEAANEAFLLLDRAGDRRTLRRMRRCLVAHPSSYAGLLYGGMVLRNHDRLDEAVRCMERALAIDPGANQPKEQLWKIRENWGWGGRGEIGRFVDRTEPDADERFFRTTAARFFPRHIEDFDDLELVMRRDIFHGYLPDRPVIASDKSVVTIGSCFAQHIRQFLIRHGRHADRVPIPEGLNNTFAVRQFVDWVEGRDELVYSYEKAADGRMERWDADKDREAFRKALAAAGGFIVTVGVAEVWKDRTTDGVYWRGVPASQFDPGRHEHMLSTVEQNAENLLAICDGLRRLAGDVPVVCTLSPVPLIATMREGTSIFAADAVSKSTLRVAIETALQRSGGRLRYWPSFEAFRWLGGHLGRSLYGGEDNPRHPDPEMIGRVIKLFVEHYFEPVA
ncbi:hypothetical protein GCM10017083_53910 [Thalassobaculum fulvum]|uniref:GSCFA domain-containing protein n=2 Tax=Thalassobaculum fulvum TaxID=1633335 RepID=A0A918XXT4_9PROT|nr:hypothetical protein GCM10017083_53910 [Thalassobaculum fulvum]